MGLLTGPKPGEIGYEDCKTWVEVRARASMLDHNILAKFLTSLIFGWAVCQYVAFTASGVDVSYWWDVLVAFVLPWRLMGRAFALSLAYRVYGGVVPIVSLWHL